MAGQNGRKVSLALQQLEDRQLLSGNISFNPVAGVVSVKGTPGSDKLAISYARGNRVKVVLTGHLHRELIHRRDGILFVTTPPVSFGLPKGKQAEGWTLVTVPASGEAQAEFKHIK